MKIEDPQGTWYQSKAQYPLRDPISGTNFEPAVPVKATATAWVKGQPAICPIDDPLAPVKAKK